MKSIIAIQNTEKLIVRDYTDALGRPFKLTFTVALIQGEFRARLVKVEPIDKPSSLYLKGNIAHSTTLCLPIFCKHGALSTDFDIFRSVVSPYIELYFLTSQPTRAPSISIR